MARKIPPILKEIKLHKPEKVNYAYQKNISFSQYSMWKSCPKKWSLQYRDGHKKFSSSIHSVFGTAFHETLQHYLTVMYDDSVKAADAIDINEYLKDQMYMVQYLHQM